MRLEPVTIPSPKAASHVVARPSRAQDALDLHGRHVRGPGAAPSSGRCPARPGALGQRLLWAVALLLGGHSGLAAQDPFDGARQRMVEEQILQRGVRQPEVLSAMRQVPRHLFVPAEHRSVAYADRPIPIAAGQTISQPYIVALMTELLELDGSEKILEIGTGSGYHAAVLSRVARRVFSIEILEELGRQAQENLRQLGYSNVAVRVGDGYQGWPEEAPFDAIILTAAPPRIPKPLIEQLRVGGRMVVPEGSFIQDLKVLVKTPDGLEERSVTRVRFLPMTGEVQRDDGGS